MALIVVTGSPGCGKSTWVRHTAKPGDVRFDGDALTNLITGKEESKHHHDSASKKISKAMRDAGIREATKHQRDIDIYVLVSNLDRKEEHRWRALGARFIIIDPGEDVAMQRCKAHRPGYKQRLVESWYNRKDEWPADAEIISDYHPTTDVPTEHDTSTKPNPRRDDGMGWRHQKRRTQLKAQLKDGEPCWWCGRPMHRDQVLHADHSASRKHSGPNSLADRLLHGACNEQRQEGENDHRRPALGASDAFDMRPIRLTKGGFDNRYPVRAPTARTERRDGWFQWS